MRLTGETYEIIDPRNGIGRLWVQGAGPAESVRLPNGNYLIAGLFYSMGLGPDWDWFDDHFFALYVDPKGKVLDYFRELAFEGEGTHEWSGVKAVEFQNGMLVTSTKNRGGSVSGGVARYFWVEGFELHWTNEVELPKLEAVNYSPAYQTLLHNVNDSFVMGLVQIGGIVPVAQLSFAWQFVRFDVNGDVLSTSEKATLTSITGIPDGPGQTPPHMSASSVSGIHHVSGDTYVVAFDYRAHSTFGHGYSPTMRISLVDVEAGNELDYAEFPTRPWGSSAGEAGDEWLPEHYMAWVHDRHTNNNIVKCDDGGFAYLFVGMHSWIDQDPKPWDGNFYRFMSVRIHPVGDSLNLPAKIELEDCTQYPATALGSNQGHVNYWAGYRIAKFVGGYIVTMFGPRTPYLRFDGNFGLIQNWTLVEQPTHEAPWWASGTFYTMPLIDGGIDHAVVSLDQRILESSWLIGERPLAIIHGVQQEIAGRLRSKSFDFD